MEPSLKALASENIREHSDVDVKVATASCVSKITRITAPDAPFEDEQMRVGIRGSLYFSMNEYRRGNVILGDYI
ncbi:hypothetical protein Syun_001291 [Stephania yunnanensis]|uniref:Uncharacterized protein n=1 Tax=Stephania yunnanensis TaxID=152371 RepID=A0AAP0QAR7_9MAGN